MSWYVGDVRVVERSQGLVFLEFFFTTLAVVTVSMRVYTRGVLVKHVGIDDIIMCFAVVSLIFTAAGTTYLSQRLLLTDSGSSLDPLRF
jgi:hypothetical protein